MNYKKDIIDKIQNALLNEVEYIRMNKNKTTEEKVDEIDVLFDTVRFLKDYEENVKILKKAQAEKGRYSE